MPTYCFKHKQTGEVIEKVMKIAEKDVFLQENADFEIYLQPANLADPVRLGIAKPNEGFRDVLRKIKGKFHGSTINTW